MGKITVERNDTSGDTCSSDGDYPYARAFKDTAETYRESYLKTAHCLAVARGALAFAVKAMETGNPSTYALGVIKKDIATIDGLMT